MHLWRYTVEQRFLEMIAHLVYLRIFVNNILHEIHQNFHHHIWVSVNKAMPILRSISEREKKPVVFKEFLKFIHYLLIWWFFLLFSKIHLPFRNVLIQIYRSQRHFRSDWGGTCILPEVKSLSCWCQRKHIVEKHNGSLQKSR